jgi:hypothetical protein
VLRRRCRRPFPVRRQRHPSLARTPPGEGERNRRAQAKPHPWVCSKQDPP